MYFFVVAVLSGYDVENVTQPFVLPYSTQPSYHACNGSLATQSLSFIATQRGRHEQLRATCQNRSSKSHVTISQLSNILVDDHHRVMYCAIPKVGCTNWKRILVYIAGRRNMSLKETGKLKIHEYSLLRGMGIRRLSDFSKQGIVERLATYYKFMFVRHPLERLLSAYKDKFTKYNKYTKYFHHRYGRTIIKSYRQNASDVSLLHGHDVTFPEFVEYILNLGKDARNYNPHWRQYTQLCFPCDISYNFIGNIETIDEDSRYVLSRILNTSCPPQFPSARNGRQATANTTREYYMDVPARHVDKLEQIYKDDMEMFNYGSLRYIL